MPKQIAGQVEEDWTNINKKGAETVTLSDLKKICNASVVGLGKLGGKDKFVAKKFTQVTNELYKNQKEFSKTDTVKIVTQLVHKAEGKEN